MNTKTRGGIRPNAGRKKAEDPKQPILLYVETSIIHTLGGKEALQQKLYTYLQNEIDTIRGEQISNTDSITQTSVVTIKEAAEKFNVPPKDLLPSWDRTTESWMEYKAKLKAWEEKK